MGEKTPKAQSRREFVKTSAVVGTAAAVGESPFSIRPDQSQEIEWDRQADVVVIGAGRAGSLRLSPHGIRACLSCW